MTSSTFAIVIMGISGCGKSTVGRELAQATGYLFVEGDALHTPQNIAKMASGVALTDEDRWPWLERIADTLSGVQAECADVKGRIVTCSALRRVYRDLLRSRVGEHLIFAFLDVPVEAAKMRLQSRPDHYMPASLVDSQRATLEVPTPDERVLTLDGEADLSVCVSRILEQLGQMPSQEVAGLIETPALSNPTDNLHR